MRIIAVHFFYILMLVACSFSVQADKDASKLIKAMQTHGHILMIRHANAPGYGDNENIKIGDCSTQRNLDQQGRQQSVNIGEWLRSNKIKPSAIYSSQWCRCMDTAQLLNLGQVKELPPLNSFFEMRQNRESSLIDLKQFIFEQTHDSSLIIMVTHSATISAISGQSVASGDGVLLKLNKSAPYQFVDVFSAEKTKQATKKP